MKKAVVAEKSPKAVGPYSQAVKIGDLVFVSGQIGIDPKTDEMVKGGINVQTHQTLKNLDEVLKAAGTGQENVLKVTVYLANMADFPVMNGIYGKFFREPYPARATVQVVKLPKDALIEIECIAYKSFHRDDNEGSGCCGKC
ncbi:MAG: translation initiation inhibitor, TdcF protein [Candidatus Gottesmanbacteria bacterium GW2011_GWA2_43_14]|uniref:Translation initiation inhibitor, TdcF protein n=1 Tax=Candidatus Gottesmanbacteria bacterium GW2011_GWA2_43_14 TaxID=1618443 RepID=A0A0G1DER8_9BACT|nr:MAG: translation initiation inhibitor, TdcF protein [Candidatus Gottesmanbacteria bacterium GW2011_GWA2_43_14]